ncbi:MAG: hypothetical protein AAF571_13535, partial [Verrucomicrobiota bacterium]
SEGQSSSNRFIMSSRLMRFVFGLMNMLGVAGVGTYMAGRKRMGIIQIILSLTSFCLTLFPMLYLFSLIEKFEGVNFLVWQIGLYQGEYELRTEYLKPFGISVAAVLLFLINLLWSLTTTKPVKDTPPPIPE